MISYLKGILTAVYHPVSFVVDVQGVGYNVLVPSNLFEQLPVIGQPIQLHTTLIIREDAHTLYGFLSPQERMLFEGLIAASGVGPKLALSLMSHLKLPELIGAITQANYTLLCRIPGVGKKTAERLVLELKDKLPCLLPLSDPIINSALSIQAKQIQDATQALVNLGYTQSVALKAVRQATDRLAADNYDLATLITLGLKEACNK